MADLERTTIEVYIEQHAPEHSHEKKIIKSDSCIKKFQWFRGLTIPPLPYGLAVGWNDRAQIE